MRMRTVQPTALLAALCLAVMLLAGCVQSPAESGADSTVSGEEISNMPTAGSQSEADSAPEGTAGSAPTIDTTASSRHPGAAQTDAVTTRRTPDPTERQTMATTSVMDALAAAPRWKQERFYLSTFNATAQNQLDDVYRRALTANKEAGITLIENSIMSTEDLETCMDICEELGLDFLAQDISRFSGMGNNYPKNNADTFYNVVEKYSEYKHLLGYFLWDEPDEANFKKYAAKQNMFVKLDPGSLCYGLLLPSYGAYAWDPKNMEDSAYRKYVDNFIATCDPDVLSVDYYPLRRGNESLMETDLWRDIGYFRKKALETGKPLWFYFQASKFEKELTDEQIKVQMYAALAYGTAGLSYYTTSNILTDAKGNKTARFNALKTINAGVNHMGQMLFTQKAKAIYHTGLSAELTKAYSLNTVGDADCPFVSAPDGLIISTFTGSRGTTLVVVNKDYAHAVSGTLTLTSARAVQSYDKATDRTSALSSSTDRIDLSVPAGDCAVYFLG